MDKTKLFILLKNHFFNIFNNELKKIPSIKKIEDKYLEEISGGNLEIVKKITKPFYYTGYGLGYGIVKIPIIGYTVYHSIKDAILGFCESLYNF